MLILGVTSPQGEKTLRRGGVPERLRQDQFRDDDPAAGLRGLEGHDDRRRHRVDEARHDDGYFHAINPEAGYFGVAPGTSYESNPNAMEMLKAQRHLHQRRADRRRRRVVGRDDQDAARAPHRLAGQGLDAGLRSQGGASERTLHRRRPRSARRSIPRGTIPAGVPISAFIFGARRSRTRCRSSARRVRGRRASTRRRRWARRRPPPPPAPSARCAATRSRCCRSAATTSATTSSTGSRWARRSPQPPRIFSVNWFRKDADGKFVWPGFGQNMRVLQWIVERCRGRAAARRDRRGPGARVRRSQLDRHDVRRRDATREVMRVDARAVGARARVARRAVRQARRQAAGGAAGGARAARRRASRADSPRGPAPLHSGAGAC